jgi:hypothetical protein
MFSTRTFIGVLVIIAAIVVVLGIAVSSLSLSRANKTTKENETFITCVTNWANETSERTRAITVANAKRIEKLDVLIRDFGQFRQGSNEVGRQKFFKDFDAYIEASDTYYKVLRDNPIPESPKLACPNGKE